MGLTNVNKSAASTMNPVELQSLIDAVARGEIDVGRRTRAPVDMRCVRSPFEDLGFARVDHHRAVRQGFPEVVLGLGKTPPRSPPSPQRLSAADSTLLVTRASEAAYDAVATRVPQAIVPRRCTQSLRFASRTSPGQGNHRRRRRRERPTCRVAEEAARTAELMGNDVERAVRRRRRRPPPPARRAARGSPPLASSSSSRGWRARCRVSSPASSSVPVIAVPTSVGYGASFGGLAALLGMLNSCASGVVGGQHRQRLRRRRHGQPDQSFVEILVFPRREHFAPLELPQRAYTYVTIRGSLRLSGAAPSYASTMQPGVLRALEFDRIVEALQSFALTPMGEERLGRLAPSSEPSKVAELLTSTSETRRYLSSNPLFPLRASTDLPQTLEALAVQGRMLEPLRLLTLADFLDSIDEARVGIRRMSGSFGSLEAVTANASSFKRETAQVREKIDASGEVVDQRESGAEADSRASSQTAHQTSRDARIVPARERDVEISPGTSRHRAKRPVRPGCQGRAPQRDSWHRAWDVDEWRQPVPGAVEHG